MADEISQRDPNRVTSLLAKGSSGGDTIALLADDTTKRLLVAATTDIGLTEDTAHTTGDTGVMIFGVRQDTQSDFGADGDYVPLSIDANGAVRVSGGGGGTQYAVDAALGATPTGNLMIAQRDDALSTLTPIEGDAVGLRVDANGALWVIPSGTTTVDNGGTFVVQVDGDALTALQKIDDPVLVDDAAFTPGTSNVMMAGFEFDDVTPDSVDEGDAGAARMSANRNIYIQIRDAAGNERGVNVDASNQLLVAEANSTAILADTAIMSGWDNGASDGASVSGDVAHDTADAGEPVKVGFKAESSPKGITLVADADRTDGYADIDGIQMVKLNTSNADIISERVSNTDGASTAFTNFSAVASTKNYVTAISLHNASATDGYVDFRDGTSGSVLYTVAIPAGGGATLASSMPLFATSANTALAYDVSAALTTVYISITGFQSKA